MQSIQSKLTRGAKSYTHYKKISSPDNILINHFSIGSDISKFIEKLPDKKILIYHNITPYQYFLGIDDRMAHLLRAGRLELARSANCTDLALADSEYSRLELVNRGFKNTGVLPIIIDLKKYSKEPDQEVLREFDDDCVNLIFVGRLVPNKRQEDILKIFYYFKRICPTSRLFLVGSKDTSKNYYVKLQNLIESISLKDVHIVGLVNFRALLAYYKLADIFISMSEHEGFCVPLLECMYFGIPIVAYNSSAVPYTLNGSGVLVNEKRYEELAELIYILIKDEKIRNRIIQKQKLQLGEFDKSKIEVMLKNYIEQVFS